MGTERYSRLRTRSVRATLGAVAAACLALALGLTFASVQAARGAELTAQAGSYTITFANTPYSDVKTNGLYETKIVENTTSHLGMKAGSMDDVTAAYNSSTGIPANGFSVVGYRFLRWAAHYPEDEDEPEDNPEQVKDLDSRYYSGDAVSGTMAVKFSATNQLPDYNLLPLEAVWYKVNGYSVHFSAYQGEAKSMFYSTDDSLKRESYAWDSASVNVVDALDYANVNPDTYVGKLTDDQRAELEWWTQPDGKGYQFTSAVPFYTLATEGGAVDPVTADTTLKSNGGVLVLYPYMRTTTPPAPTTYTVTYHNDGADSGVAPVDGKAYETGDEVTVLGNVGTTPMVKSGYTFKGWKVSADATTLAYDTTGATAPKFNMGSGNVDLFPYWEEDVTYSIEYGNTPYSDNVTGNVYDQAITEDATSHLGAKSGTMSPTTGVAAGSWANVAANTFSVVGYRLAAWGVYRPASGSDPAKVEVIASANGRGSAAQGTYQVKFSASELSDAANKVLNLESIWTKHQGYSVSFSENFANANATFASADNSLVRDAYAWDSSVPAIDARDYAEAGTTTDVGKLSSAERASLEWWTQPGGKGYQFTTAVPFYTLATEDGAKGAVAADTALQSAGNEVVLYPYLPTISVTYYGNRNDSDTSAISSLTQTVSSTTASVDVKAQPSSLTKTGYTFVGWSESATTKPTETASIHVPGGANESLALAGADKQLYAVWKANAYKVSVHGDYANPTTETASVDAVYDEDVTLTRPAARAGYTFGGWATSSGVKSKTDPSVIAPSSGSVENNDEKYKNLTATEKGTVPVYPVWVPNDDVDVTLSVTDPVTGNTTTTTVSNPGGSVEATLSAPSNVPQGYIFKGWYANSDGTGNLYGKRPGTSKTDAGKAYDGTMDGSTVANCTTTWPAAAGTTLYAVFTEVEGFKINYVNSTLHKNANGKPSQIEIREKDGADKAIKWTSTGIVPTDMAVDEVSTDGYVFKGWFRQADVNTDGTLKDGVSVNDAIATTISYKDLASKLVLTDDPTNLATLYAGWEAADSVVTFENGEFTAANGEARTPLDASDESSYTATTKVDKAIALPCNFTLVGYDFKYWKCDDGASVRYFDETGTEVGTDGKPVTSGTAYKAGVTGTNGNKLVAQWQPIEYKVVFEDGSGNVSTANELTIAYDGYAGKTFAAGTIFTKSGYTFKNWKNAATSGEGVNETYEGGAAITKNLRSTAGNVVLQAQWGIEVTFRFTPGAGTLLDKGELPDPVSKTSGGKWGATEVPLVPTALVRDGYLEEGWTDGADHDYANRISGEYDVPETTAPITVILFPKWKGLSTSVLLHYSDNDDPTLETTKTYDKDKNEEKLVTGGVIELPEMSRPGYAFLGWSTSYDNFLADTVDVNASVKDYVVPYGDEIVVGDSDYHQSNLYAVWQAGAVTIKFDGNGAMSGSMANQTNLIVGAETGELNASTFKRDGYDFVGWVLEANVDEKLDSNGVLRDEASVDYDDKQEFNAVMPVPAPVNNDGSIVLMAAWEPAEYTIEFNPNGADGITENAKQTGGTSASSEVQLNGPTNWTRTGYTFDGWSKSSSRTENTTGDYRNGDNYTVDTSGAAGANTLYAIWKPSGVTYAIERYLEKADGTWEKAADSTTAPLVGTQNGTTGDAVSIAGDVSVYTGFTLDATVTGASVDGVSGTVSTKLSDTVAADSSTVLRAFYKRNVHSVTYKLDPAGQATPNGFTLPAGHPSVKYGATKVTVNSADVDLKVEDAPTATGWTFTGWETTDVTLDQDGNFAMPDQDVVFTGSWEQTKYAVTFSIDSTETYEGATGTGSLENAPSEIKVASGQKMDATQKALAAAVKVTPPAKGAKEYYHSGWKKSTDGGSNYTACGNPWDETITGATVFAPVFSATFTVVYKPGDGGDFADNAHPSLASDANFPAFSGTTEQVEGVDTPKAKAGYVFAGWKVADTSSTAVSAGDVLTLADIASKASGTIDGNYTLVAQWTRTDEAKHNLDIDYDGGAVAVGSVVVAANADAPSADVTVAVGDEDFATTEVGEGVSVHMPAVSKAGYVFGGWTVVAGGLATPVGALGTFSMPAADVELKAVWSLDASALATITYRSANTDMGDVSVKQQAVDASSGDVKTADPSSAITLGSVAQPKHGYRFDAWTLVGSADVLADVDSDTGSITPKADGENGFADRTYQASFKKASFAVEMVAKPGCEVKFADDFTEGMLDVEYMGSLPKGKITAEVAADSDYKVAGWLYEMDADGDGTFETKNTATSLLADPGELVVKGKVKIWPALSLSKANVTYNLNDPAVADVKDNTKYEEKALVNENYTVKGIVDIDTLQVLPGYTFLGWATSATGAVEYSAAAIQDGTAIAPIGESGLTLYAKWQGEKVTVTYAAGDHYNTEAAEEYKDEDNYAGGKATVKTLAETGIEAATGYVFAGWLGSDGVVYRDGSDTQVTEIAALPGAGLTLTAQWKLGSSDVVYHANNGTNESTSLRYAALLDFITLTKYDVENGLDRMNPKPLFERAGYTFQTWNEKADGTGDEYIPGSRYTMPAVGGIEVYAQWAGKYAELTLNAGEGASFSGDRASVTYTGVTGQELKLSDIPARKGYDFKGWSRTENSETADAGLADEGNTGVTVALGNLVDGDEYAASKTLYAVWVLTPADKEALKKAVEEAEDAEKDVKESDDGNDVEQKDKWTTPEDKKKLDDAIKKAKDVLDDDTATQDEVDKALEDLEKAKEEYEKAKQDGKKPNTTPSDDVDKDALKAAIAAAKATEQGVRTSGDGTDVDPANKWTTPAEKKALDDAIKKAQAVMDDPAATQSDVDKATAAVSAAKDAYDAAKKDGKKTGPVSIDKSKLRAAVNAGEATEQGVKQSGTGLDVDPKDKWTTPAEKKALDDAIAAAKAVLNDPDATQAEVDIATGAMNAAKESYDAAKKNGLKGQAVQADPNDPDNNGNGSGNGNGDGSGDNGSGNGNGSGDNGNGNGAGNDGDGSNGSGDGNGSGDNGGEVITHVMYRLYNPYSGEHHYTADADERDDVEAAGWIYEGIAWVAPDTSETPVYRLYNSHEPLGDHHYTTDKDEYEADIAAGWTGEGIGWYSDDAQEVPLYRVYNPYAYLIGMTGAHHYTADVVEADGLVPIGWIAEGTAWYGVADDSLYPQSSALAAGAF